jgi:hypothetical protein
MHYVRHQYTPTWQLGLGLSWRLVPHHPCGLVQRGLHLVQPVLQRQGAVHLGIQHREQAWGGRGGWGGVGVGRVEQGISQDVGTSVEGEEDVAEVWLVHLHKVAPQADRALLSSLHHAYCQAVS